MDDCTKALRDMVLDRDARITQLEAQCEALKVRIEQHRGALGYPVRGDIPDDPTIQCGLCDAKAKYIKELEARVEEMSKRAAEIAAVADACHDVDHDWLAEVLRAPVFYALNPDAPCAGEMVTPEHHWGRGGDKK